MPNNEDYLDSLLKAAESHDDPESAINKVREISRKDREEAEKAKAEQEAAERKEKETESATDLDSLFANVTGDSSFAEPSSSVLSADSESSIDAGNDDALSNLLAELEAGDVSEGSDTETVDETGPSEVDIMSLLGASAGEATPASAEIDALDSMAAESGSVVSGDTYAEATVVEEPVDEEPVTEESSVEDMLGELSSQETVESGDTEAQEPGSDDLDSLLKSGFSGEIEVGEDIASLLESAEAFASEEVPETADASPDSETALKEAETEPESVEIGDVSIDDLLGALSETTEAERLADDASDVIGGMSETDIEDLLSGVKETESAEPEGEVEVDLSDLSAFESTFGIRDKNDVGLTGDESGDGELDEISNLLKTIDSTEASEDTPVIDSDMDMLELLNQAVSQQEEIEKEEELRKEKKLAEIAESEELAKQEKEAKKAKRKLPFFKKKKEESSEEGIEVLDKKPSFFAKIIDFITAEEESEEEESLLNPTDIVTEGGSEGNLEDAASGENKKILEEIDGQAEDGKGKKKKKKKKGKKGDSAPKGEGGEESDDESAGDKKKKVKVKKERKPLVLDIDTGKPLSKKNVILIFVLAATFLVFILLVVKFIPGMLTNSSARRAYYKGDYETTYSTFYGEKLNESDQILFERSEVILKMLHKYDSYRAYMNMEKRTEALDQLLQGVSNYEKWLIVAERTGATDNYNLAYSKVLGALSGTFGLTEDDAKRINALETNLEYTLMCESIANNTEYIDPNQPIKGDFVPPSEDLEVDGPVYEDMLPEEGN